MDSNLRHGSTAVSITLSLTLICLTACGDKGAATDTSYAYVASATSRDGATHGAVFQYAISSNGSLTPLRIASVSTGASPVAITSERTGHYVYVANRGDATISQYSIGTGGVLTPLTPATMNLGEPSATVNNISLSVNPSGHSLYAVIISTVPPVPAAASIAQFSIGNDGTLSPLNPASISVATGVNGPLALDPSGVYAYLPGQSLAGEFVPAGAATVGGEVLQFSVASGGELTPLSSATVTAKSNAIGVTVSPGDKTAYVLSSCVDNACEGQIAEYAVNDDGTLTPTGTMTLTASHVIPISLIADASGSSAYLLTNLMGVDTNAGAVYQYDLDTADALIPVTPASLNVTSGAVAQIVLTTNLYVLSSKTVEFPSGSPGGYIDHYSIGVSGRLSPAGTIAVPSSYPTAMTIAAPR